MNHAAIPHILKAGIKILPHWNITLPLWQYHQHIDQNGGGGACEHVSCDCTHICSPSWGPLFLPGECGQPLNPAFFWFMRSGAVLFALKPYRHVRLGNLEFCISFIYSNPPGCNYRKVVFEIDWCSSNWMSFLYSARTWSICHQGEEAAHRTSSHICCKWDLFSILPMREQNSCDKTQWIVPGSFQVCIRSWINGPFQLGRKRRCCGLSKFKRTALDMPSNKSWLTLKNEQWDGFWVFKPGL